MDSETRVRWHQKLVELLGQYVQAHILCQSAETDEAMTLGEYSGLEVRMSEAHQQLLNAYDAYSSWLEEKPDGA